MAATAPDDVAPGMTILLRYKGPAIESGLMDVYDVAANMVAFSDFVVGAARKLYGDDIQIKAEVSSFRAGSFITDLFFQVAGLTGAIWAANPNITTVIEVVKESLGLFNFLHGEAPARITHLNDESVTVVNNSGNVTVVKGASLHLTLDESAGRSVAKFVAQALSKSGIEEFDISTENTTILEAKKQDAQYYHPILDESPVVEQTVRMGLMVEMPSFKEGNKWHMWDGEASLVFGMEDQEFLARIDNGEPFRKGDILVCEVRVTQTKSGESLKIKRSILKVYDHKSNLEQDKFNF